MASLKDQLNDYLSKSSNDSGSSQSLLESEKSGLFSGFSWGRKSESPNTVTEIDETSNGWFTEAKNDPCLPSLAMLYLPFLILKARKFAMLYSLGSIFIIASFSLLWGPVHHVKHLLTAERLPFTTVYFGTMFATIYFSIWVKSTVFTVIFAIAQIIALIWYIVSYIPGGQTGLKFFSRIFYSAASKTVQKTLPV